MNLLIGSELVEVSIQAESLMSERNWLGRFLHSDGDGEAIKNMKDKVKAARELFQVCFHPLVSFRFPEL